MTRTHLARVVAVGYAVWWTAACGQSDSANVAARVDSVLVSVDSLRGGRISRELPDTVKQELFLRANDPHAVLRDFLTALPVDSTDSESDVGDAAEALFGRFSEDPRGVATLAEFVWGEIGSGRLDQYMSEAMRPCHVEEPCFAEALQLAPRERERQPAIIAVERPRLEEFFSAPLVLTNGTTVLEQRRSRAAQGYVAYTVCVNGKPTVRYSPDIEQRFSPIGVAFVRAHEFGHVLLGHVSCTKASNDASVGQRELAADCEAARLLVARIPNGGVGVVAYAAGQLSQLDWRTSDGVTARHRSESLFREQCG